MNASNLKFFTEDIKSDNPAIQSRAFQILFGKINRTEDEGGKIIEKQEGGSSYIKKPLNNIIPKIFSDKPYLDVYKIVQDMLFMHLRSLDYSNVKNLRTWLWSTVENFIKSKEDNIRIELGGNDPELPPLLSHGSDGEIQTSNIIQDADSIANKYLEELKNLADGDYLERLINSIVLGKMSLDEFMEEENSYRLESGKPLLTDTKAISRHKYNAIQQLIRIACTDTKRLRKQAYLKLQKEGLLDEDLELIEDTCLNGTDIMNNQRHLVKRMFDKFNDMMDESWKNTLGYYKEYHWIYNKYTEKSKDNTNLQKLNTQEIKSLNLYFTKGIINNNILFAKSLIKLGDNSQYIEAMPDKMDRFRNRHEEICSLKDSPEIIEEYFIDSYKEYQDYQQESKEQKLADAIKEQQKQRDEQMWSAQFSI